MGNFPGKITLIGAGPAGALLSIYLAGRGFEVELYERRPDMRKTPISAGRSINLAISTRGIHALREVGVLDSIMKIAVPMKGRMMHAVTGELTFQPYGKDETEVIYAVLRSELSMALMNEAEKYPRVKIHFNERCTGMDFKTGEVELRHEITGKTRKIPTELVIGTDGSASAIRLEMMKVGRFNFSQQYLAHGYKELIIPAGPNGHYRIEKNALHIWPRKTYMLIALPNIDGSFASIFFFPFEGEPSFASLDTEEKVQRFFQEQFPDVVPLMPNLLENYFANPIGTMVTVKCEPWHVGDKALLLGDAAHAIVPFFGQGVNCAFESCTYFIECLDKHGADWLRVFQEFERMRKVDTDAIAELALENFIEMRDRVADPKFLFKKKVELELEKKYPTMFVPKYSMVTFHRLPYSVALARGKIQDRILAELCDAIERIEDLDWDKAERLLGKDLGDMQIQR
ncbi:MAG: FAD-dependent monooxygenase [candidate division KSB1 bacterium]|nr:FAD-dependent monooxygenase [candidate division KSB1 bacterium]MDZ7365894.1 FAD-dependent monooxygenase [candidate division KSB1 bacterium]MDZ7403872.1 FAD-dependent monooxygenase [candidate division KSB1 bacterium]